MENIVGLKFEFLSISYIMTEGLILLLYGILQDFEDAKLSGSSDEPENLSAEAADLVMASDTSVAPPEQKYTDEQIKTIFGNWSDVRSLTQREKEVLIFILERRKSKDIAQVLFVTESTIKKHTSNIYKKLEVTSRAELFEKASTYSVDPKDHGCGRHQQIHSLGSDGHHSTR